MTKPNRLPGEKFVIADPLYHLLPEERKKAAFLNIFAADMGRQAVEMDKRQKQKLELDSYEGIKVGDRVTLIGDGISVGYQEVIFNVYNTRNGISIEAA